MLVLSSKGTAPKTLVSVPAFIICWAVAMSSDSRSIGGVLLANDGYTYRTRDGSRASHHEHTILIEKDGARIITQ